MGIVSRNSKVEHLTLFCVVALSLIAPGTTQLVVKTLSSNSFGKSNDPVFLRPAAAVKSRTVAHSRERAPVDSKVRWKQVAARLAATVDAGTGAASEWEQHKQQKAIDSQIADLKHAQGALGYLEERAANKLKADIDEVDHLIVRKHLLTDKTAENAKDISVIEAHAASLKQVAGKVGAKGAGAIDDEIRELDEAAATLRGRPGEFEELNKEIDATTDDGRRMDSEVRRISKGKEAVGRQIRVLTQEGDELQDSEETARDFEAFERKGYDDMADKNDPYVQEATEALERASGWSKNDLDAQAVKAREAMTKGLAANPGEAVRALRAVRPYRRF